MKTKLTLAMLLIAMAVTSALAQDKANYNKVRIGLGLEGALPLGNFGNAYNVGGGVTLRAAYALNETSAITATSGLIAFVPKSISGTNLKAELNIPIKGGYKYMLTPQFYGLGEAGATIAQVYYPDAAGTLHSASSTEFTYAVSLGAHLGGFDPSIRYEAYTGTSYVALRLGFNF